MMFLRPLAILAPFLALLLLPVSSGHAVPNAELPAGYALDFDGVDDYAHANPFYFISGTSPVTLEAWLFPRSFPMPDGACDPHRGLSMIVGRGKSGDNLGGDFQLRIEADGTVNYHLYSKHPLYGERWDWVRSANAIGLDSWTHVAGVYDGLSMRVFLNGEQDPNSATTTHPHDDLGNVHPIRLGAYERRSPDTGPNCLFDGAIDEVRVWNIARTPDEIQEHMHTSLVGDEPGFVVYWRLDEGEGQIFNDATSNGYDGELGSTPTSDDNDPAWHSIQPTVGGLGSFTAHFVPAPPLDQIVGMIAPMITLVGLTVLWLWWARGLSGKL